MVWGVEMAIMPGRRQEWANAFVLACYTGTAKGDGIHLLGPLSKKVVRVAPPLVITQERSGWRAYPMLSIGPRR